MKMLSLRRVINTLFEDVVILNHHRRGFAKTLHPVAVRNTNNSKIGYKPINFEHGNIDVEEVRKEFRKEVRHEFRLQGDIAETDLHILNNDSYDQAQQEQEKLRSHLRKSKMYRKHFRDVLGRKEISVLTYAEKEKIRYLYSTDSEEWTPERLSVAFPVSPEGVLKLVKSSMKARSIEDIQAHDKMVAARIDKIKSGEIPMTPELEEKMKMREKIPLNIGAIDPYNKDMLLKLEPVKYVGEFQRLVSPVVRPDSKTRTLSTINGVSPPERSTGDGGLGQAEPDLGDFYDLKPTAASKKELRKLKVSLRKVMTFEEFKSKMKLGGGTESKDREIKHIAKLSDDDASEVRPTTLSDFEKDDKDQIQNHKSFSHPAKNKFQSSESTAMETGPPNAEHKRQHVATGHHQTKDRRPERVKIPNTSTNHDVIYQQGTSYYDDNGEFLYKVV